MSKQATPLEIEVSMKPQMDAHVDATMGLPMRPRPDQNCSTYRATRENMGHVDNQESVTGSIPTQDETQRVEAYKALQYRNTTFDSLLSGQSKLGMGATYLGISIDSPWSKEQLIALIAYLIRRERGFWSDKTVGIK